MPEYEYKCTKCKHKRTITQAMTDKLPTSLLCDKCQSIMIHDITNGKSIIMKPYMKAF